MTSSKYVSVAHKDDDATNAVGVKSSAEVKEVFKIPIPLDAEGNPMSYEDASTTWSYWTMSFLNPLFKKGFSEEGLALDDLGKVSERDKTNNLYNRFWAQWLLETKKPVNKRSLWLVLWRTAGWCHVAYAISLYAVFSALGFVPVMILNQMLQYFEGVIELSTTQIWGLAALMLLVPIASSLLAVQSNTMLAHLGIDFRNALIGAIFRKSMVLSPSSRAAFSTGQIVNMFSADTRQIQAFLFFMNNVVMAPAQIAVAIYLIYQQVKTATWVGLGFMMAMMPINGAFFKYLTHFRRTKVGISDRRVKLMNEVLTGVRIIKYYAWELAFEGKITAIRDEEMVYLKKIAYLVAGGFTLVMMAVPLVQPIVVFLTYVQLGNELTATTAFTTIALFNVMQLPFAFLPMGLQQFSQSLVSCKRMCDFFACDELLEYVTHDPPAPGADEDVVISAQDASFFWTEETPEFLDKVDKQREDSLAVVARDGDEKAIKSGKYALVDHVGGLQAPTPPDVGVNRSCHTLMNMSFKIRKGQLVAVVGSVGSGKSSFLNAIMGELNKKAEGSLNSVGSIAYCAQQPWIFNETMRENVLFGREYEEKLFDRAVHACAIEDDIRILPGGVLTEIGERGINLSGGQKARVSLGRAVYRQADIYLLDDPLSAVDAHVGEHLFSECIQKELAGKTRILVTHHVHLLPKCDHIIILKDGYIKAQGSYQDLQSSGVDIDEFVRNTSNDSAETAAEDEAGRDRAGSSTSSNGKRSRSGTAIDLEKDKDTEKLVKAERRHKDTRKSTLMSLEERKLGDVTSETYMYYLRAGGIGWFLGGLSIQVIAQVFGVLSFFWLSEWGKESVESALAGQEMTTDRSMFYLRFYSMLSMLGLLCTFTRALMIAQHRVATSSILHSDLLRVVLSAPVRFYDTTPLGRVLNRFSSDMQVVDEELSQTIGQITNSFFNVGGALLGVCAATKGSFIILMIPLGYIYRDVQKYFRKTNTTVARLAAVSLSPVYAEFSQAIGTGTSSIRAYGESSRFTAALENKVDRNTVAMVTQQLAGQWLAIRLDIMGALVSAFIAILAVSSRDQNFIPAGWLGLGMTYSFQITTFMKFCVRIMATGEAQMNSVERIMFYCEHMEYEESVQTIDGKPEIVSAVKIQEAEDKVLEDLAANGKEPPKEKTFDEMRKAKFANYELYHSVLVDPVNAAKYANWPSAGEIEFKEVCMAYSTGPMVLKDISKYSCRSVVMYC